MCGPLVFLVALRSQTAQAPSWFLGCGARKSAAPRFIVCCSSWLNCGKAAALLPVDIAKKSLANWRLSQWRYLWQPFHRRRYCGTGAHIGPVVRRRSRAIDRRVVDDDRPLVACLRLLLLRICRGCCPVGGQHSNSERDAYELHDDNLRCLPPIYGCCGHVRKGWTIPSLGLPLRSARRPIGCRPAGAHLPLALAVRTADETHRKMRRLDAHSPARVACR